MEHKILVVYKSSTGFTKRYAEWIAEELKCDLADYRKTTAEQMSQYDTVVFGTRAHAGTIDGFQKAREMFRKSTAGRLVLFVTGAMPYDAGDALEAFWKQNLTPEEMQEILHFYMPGGLCYEKMSLGDRMMMKAFGAMMRRKKDKSQEEEEMARMIAGSYDLSDKRYIRPLVSGLR